jgi:hypothetical protein
MVTGGRGAQPQANNIAASNDLTATVHHPDDTRFIAYL